MCFFKKRKLMQKQIEQQAQIIERINQLDQEMSRLKDSMRDTIQTSITVSNTQTAQGVQNSLTLMQQNISNLTTSTETRFNELKQEVSKNLEGIRNDNEKRLLEMKDVVEKKMSETINTQLSTSFQTVTDSLSAVNKNIGELQSISSSVSDLNKVLLGVKTRGISGEITLESIVSNIIPEGQYYRQYSINKASREDDKESRVDIAIRLPGQNPNEEVLLPIDSKYPIEAYKRLIDASNECDKQTIQEAKKALNAVIYNEAKDIAKKYIKYPKTVDFAIIFLPMEGLYLEVIQDAELMEKLNKEKVIPAGPNNITALLNSILVGFKTLAIQKSSEKIFEAMAKFKKEFAKFIQNIDKAQNQLDLANRTLEETKKSTNKIQRNIESIDLLESPQNDDIAQELE